LLLEDHGFGHNGTRAAGTGRRTTVVSRLQKQDREIAHTSILATSHNSQEQPRIWQFAMDRLDQGRGLPAVAAWLTRTRAEESRMSVQIALQNVRADSSDAYFTFVLLLSIMGAHFPSGPCISIVNV